MPHHKHLTLIRPLLEEVQCVLDPCFDEGGEPTPKPAIEVDEYAFIDWSLQRWHDRAYNPENKL